MAAPRANEALIAKVEKPKTAPRPVARANGSRKAQLDDAIAKMIEQKNQQKAERARSAVDRFATNVQSNQQEYAMIRNSQISSTPVALKFDPAEGPGLASRQIEEQKVLERKPIVKVSSNDFALKNPEEIPLNRLSPRELKQAFYKSYLSENKHLSAYSVSDDFDMASSDNWEIVSAEGFVGDQSISSNASQPRTLEVRMSFTEDDSALSRDNFNLLSEYASMIANNPKRAIQISVSEDAVKNADSKRLTARRLAIINQVLIDSGVSESRIIPVLVNRDDGSFVLRVISTDQFKVLRQTERDMFGDKKSQTTTRSLSW
jgi:hypothetical protein